MKKASGYRGLRRDPHGMEPSFILPATPTVARIGVRGKRTISAFVYSVFEKEKDATPLISGVFLFCKADDFSKKACGLQNKLARMAAAKMAQDIENTGFMSALSLFCTSELEREKRAR